VVLSYVIFVGTPPKNSKAASWLFWKVSTNSRGKVDTKKVSL
jgi:hypothetical protein